MDELSFVIKYDFWVDVNFDERFKKAYFENTLQLISSILLEGYVRV